ncbi:MAG: HEPN domain-containing protein [Candidatus Hydrogenedentes bacterium]|nr:HEPN domain-containing protein [Candidatus Hydrogenedentota bacterium]
MQAPLPVNYDSVCFHAQQCGEKYAKALLQEAGVAFRKTHDLGELVDLASSVNSTLHRAEARRPFAEQLRGGIPLPRNVCRRSGRERRASSAFSGVWDPSEPTAM